MFRRKNEFKPDRTGTSLLSRLYPTQRQRQGFLRWALYGGVLLGLSLLQDVLLCRLSLFGATTDLIPCAIILLGLMLPTETSAVFLLVSSLIYYFSGMSIGPLTLVFLSVPTVTANVFRLGYLKNNFLSFWICGAAAMLVYELLAFFSGWYARYTTFARLPVALWTALLSILVMPLLYPLFRAIGKIGGDTWIDG